MATRPGLEHHNMESEMTSTLSFARAAVVLAFFSSGWAMASELPGADQLPEVAQAGTKAVPIAQPDVAANGFGKPISERSLNGYRGGFEVVNNDMQLSGTVANNVTMDTVSGSNTISDGAFANLNGLPMVIQNSGSNVLIQNATIINVQMQ
ncbi:MAG: hypothetical protein RIR45_2159 [Pseudomonadota bacterium]|jgi:hypothetical protein